MEHLEERRVHPRRLCSTKSLWAVAFCLAAFASPGFVLPGLPRLLGLPLELFWLSSFSSFSRRLALRTPAQGVGFTRRPLDPILLRQRCTVSHSSLSQRRAGLRRGGAGCGRGCECSGSSRLPGIAFDEPHMVLAVELVRSRFCREGAVPLFTHLTTAPCWRSGLHSHTLRRP